MAASYYEVLGAAPGASVEDLRCAYRAAVKAVHPDTGGTAESFCAVQDAWAVLRDPISRKAYDVRTAATEGAGGRVNGAAGSTRQPPPARPAGPPPGPTPAAPPSAPDTAPRAAEPPADEPEQAPTDDGPDPEERARRRTRILLGVVITVAGVSGLLAGAIVFAIFGRFGAVAAGLYLVLVVTAVVQQRQGTGGGHRAAAHVAEGGLVGRGAVGRTRRSGLGGGAGVGATGGVRRGVRRLRRRPRVADPGERVSGRAATRPVDLGLTQTMTGEDVYPSAIRGCVAHPSRPDVVVAVAPFGDHPEAPGLTVVEIDQDLAVGIRREVLHARK